MINPFPASLLKAQYSNAKTHHLFSVQLLVSDCLIVTQFIFQAWIWGKKILTLEDSCFSGYIILCSKILQYLVTYKVNFSQILWGIEIGPDVQCPVMFGALLGTVLLASQVAYEEFSCVALAAPLVQYNTVDRINVLVMGLEPGLDGKVKLNRWSSSSPILPLSLSPSSPFHLPLSSSSLSFSFMFLHLLFSFLLFRSSPITFPHFSPLSPPPFFLCPFMPSLSPPALRLCLSCTHILGFLTVHQPS